jgi:glutathione S-transferase
MQLIGMLDSPYVRRVAISLELLGLPFEHRPISVFRQFDAFAAINPVVKAPRRSLVPAGRAEAQHDLRLIGLALAACEKAVQIVYERTLRPAEKQHAPWTDRVRGQLGAALVLLEGELEKSPCVATSDAITQAGVTVAVTWEFVASAVPQPVGAASYPALAAHSAAAEALPEFRALPSR